MTTWTEDTKPVEAPTIWTLTTEIWNSTKPEEYIELPWQNNAPSIWTNDSEV
jgi:hypothetical protein